MKTKSNFGAVSYTHLDIKGIMDGTSQNIILMKNDILYIPSIHDLEDRGNVVIHGEVAKPDSLSLIHI